MPSAAIQYPAGTITGEPGSRWTNHTGEVLYLLHVSLLHSRGRSGVAGPALPDGRGVLSETRAAHMANEQTAGGMPPIFGWYHLATIGDYRRVLAAQVAALEASGLSASTLRLHVRVSGGGPVPTLPDYAEVSRNDAPLGMGEIPTLAALKDFCRAHPGSLVYYLHSKGVSYAEGVASKANVELWREYLEHFAVWRWREAVEALADRDLYGAEWVGPGEAYVRSWGGGERDCPGRGHFAGNFWWARADYVASLPDRPMEWRYDAEWHFLSSVAEGSPPPRVACPHVSGLDLYHNAYPRARYAPGPCRVEAGAIVTSARLAEDTMALLARVPGDVDAVAAIARSGLPTGALIASCRHVPLYTVSRQAGVQMPGFGLRMDETERPQGPPRHVLLVDDTVGLGTEMVPCFELVRAAFPGARVTRAAVYAAPAGVEKVDLHQAVYPWDHYLEWNWPNSHGLECGFDFDGVLCDDCPPGDDDDGPRYAAFLEAVRPRSLPRRAPVRMIVTARREKYRAATEAWLARHGVRAERLVMRDFELDPARDRDEQVAAWKAGHYRESGLPLFAESDPWQARLIRDLSGKPVLCPALGRVLPARDAARVAPAPSPEPVPAAGPAPGSGEPAPQGPHGSKVVYVVSGCRPAGGLRVVFEHVNGLVDRGWDVVLATADGSRPDPAWHPVRCLVVSLAGARESGLWAGAGALVATHWPTAYAVAEGGGPGTRRPYFVQGREDAFHDDQAANAAARATYTLSGLKPLATSRWVKRFLEDEFGHRDVPVVPQGVDCEAWFPDPPRIRRPDEPPRVLIVGRDMGAAKNVSDAYRAVGLLRARGLAVEVWAAGDADHSENGWGRPDRMERDAGPGTMRRLYSGADLLLCSSRQEGRTLIFDEAMACGLPVVAMHCRGVDNLEGYGVIVPAGDVGALADAAERLLRDPFRREEMARRGLEHARRDLRWDAAIDALERHLGLVRPARRGSVVVLLPTRDRPHLIGRALASLGAQTRADWSAVVALNGVSDAYRPRYAEALRPHLAGKRIRVVEVAEPGIPGALSAALAAAPASDYLAVLEDDDEWLPGFLEALAAGLDRNPWAGLAYCDLEERGSTGMRTVPPPHGEYDRGAHLEANWICFPMMLVRRSALEATGGFDAASGACCDWDTGLRAAASGVWRVRRRLAVHHWHDANATARPDLMRPGIERVAERRRAGDYGPETGRTA